MPKLKQLIASDTEYDEYSSETVLSKHIHLPECMVRKQRLFADKGLRLGHC